MSAFPLPVQASLPPTDAAHLIIFAISVAMRNWAQLFKHCPVSIFLLGLPASELRGFPQVRIDSAHFDAQVGYFILKEKVGNRLTAQIGSLFSEVVNNARVFIKATKIAVILVQVDVKEGNRRKALYTEWQRKVGRSLGTEEVLQYLDSPVFSQ